MCEGIGVQTADATLTVVFHIQCISGFYPETKFMEHLKQFIAIDVGVKYLCTLLVYVLSSCINFWLLPVCSMHRYVHVYVVCTALYMLDFIV